MAEQRHEKVALDREPRGWVVRLGSYLRIFGGRPTLWRGTPSEYVDHLAELAKQREAEHGR